MAKKFIMNVNDILSTFIIKHELIYNNSCESKPCDEGGDTIKQKYLHKLCEIYVTPPDDTKKVLEILANANVLISECWDKDGRFKFEVFEEEV